MLTVRLHELPREQTLGSLGRQPLRWSKCARLWRNSTLKTLNTLMLPLLTTAAGVWARIQAGY